MAEKLADLDEVHTLGNQQARGGMSHVVEPYVRQLSCGQETRKRPEHVPLVQARAYLPTHPPAHEGREHETGVDPVGACLETFFQLARPVE